MKLTVKFMGLCMFYADSARPGDGEDVRVYLPKALANHHAEHKDETTVGEDHTAAIVLADGEVVELSGDEIEFAGEIKPKPGANRDLSRLVRMGCVADDLALADDDVLAEEIAAKTTIRGGRMHTKEDHKPTRNWRFGNGLKKNGKTKKKNKLGLSVTWEAEFEAGVTINFAGRSEHYDDDATICIVNVCGITPEEACSGGWAQPGPPHDWDFKWYYYLLKSTDGKTIEERVKEQNAELPHPIDDDADPEIPPADKSAQDEPPGVDTPTCICLFLCNCEEPDCP